MAVAKRNTSGGINRLRLFITALIAGIIGAPFLAMSSANALNMQNPQDAVKSYDYYLAVAKCIRSDYLVTSVANNQFQWDPTGSDNRIVGVGHLVDPADGQMECQNLMSSAASFWGYAGAGDALKDWGFTVDGNGYWHNDTPGSGFASKIRQKYYGGKDPSLNDIQLYTLYSTSLFVGCKTSGGVEYSKADAGVKAAVDNGTGDYVKVTIADVYADPPTTKVMVYKLGTAKTTPITVSAGSAVNPIPGDGGNDGQMQCQSLADYTSKYAAAYAQWAVNNQDAARANSPSSTTGGTATPDPCPITEESALRWVICPLVILGDNTIGKLNGLISTFLYTPVDQVFNGVDGASKNFRNIGLALVVIAGLVMIVSTALGFEFFDAYTIKKVLPRIAVAAIGIALAAPVLKFMIIITNDFGLMIGKILVASVTMPGSGTSTGIGTGIAGGAAGIGILGIAGLALGGMGLLSLVGTIVLALLIGLLVLSIRQMVIMVCVLLAPVAIAAYILPGTQKLWEFWKNALTTSLVMFPLIAAFIAAGEALSIILGASSSSQMQILALVVRYAPYFLLPFAFKLAGGLMSTIFSIANDRGKGGFDRLKKYRGAKTAENISKMKAGNRFSDRNALARGFNRRSAGIGSGWQGHFGVGERGRQAIDQARRNAGEGFKKSAGFIANQENDDALHAWTYNSAAEAKQGLMARWNGDEARVSRAIAAAQAGGGFGRVQAITAAQQLATTGTGYTDLQDQADTLARAAGGDKNTAAAMAGYNNFINKQKGRHDLAPGAGDLISLTHDSMDGKPISQATWNDKNTKAWNSGSLYQIANGKKAATSNLTSHWVRQYDEALRSGNVQQLEQATVAMREMQAMLPNASGDNQNVLNDALQSMTISRERYLRAGQANGAIDPTAKTMLDQVETYATQRARVYERPNPNVQAGP